MSRPRCPFLEKVKAALWTHLMAGGLPSEFTAPKGYAISAVYAHKITNTLGVRKYFLTAAEYAAVLAVRRNRDATSNELPRSHRFTKANERGAARAKIRPLSSAVRSATPLERQRTISTEVAA